MIADLITSDLHAQATDPIPRVAELWEKHPGADGMAVLDGPRVLYLSRARFFVQLGKRFGYALFENRPVSLLAEEGSTVEGDMDPVEVISIATQREAERIYDDILVLESRRFRGLVSMRSLLVHHKALLVDGIAERALLEEKNRRLEELGALQEEFMGSLTRDLRQPMNTLLGIAQALLVDREVRARHEKSLRALLLRVQDALATVNDLHDLLRLELGALSPLPEPADVRVLLEDVFGSLQALIAERGARLEPLQAPEALVWTADPLFLRRILANLVRAAVEAGAGGRVALETGGNPAVLSIRVAGALAGLGEAERTRLLDAAARGNDAARVAERPGRAALRLRAVKSLAARIGGTIEEDPAPGFEGGVIVRLPSSPAPGQ